MKRHFIIQSGSEYSNSILRLLENANGVTIIKDDVDGSGHQNFDIEIIIDPEKYNGNMKISELSGYEVRLIRDRDLKLAIEQERVRLLETDFAEEYQSEIYKAATHMYQHMMDKFVNEQCTVGELSDIYKKYIDSFIHDCLDDIINNINIKHKIDIRQYCQELISPEQMVKLHELININKNKWVDSIADGIMKMYNIHRGQLGYFPLLRHAGQLADLIESRMYALYTPHYIKDEAK